MFYPVPLRVTDVFRHRPSAPPVSGGHALRLPLLLWRVSAGFPSPADDHVETRLSLDELAVRNPASTFFLRVEGDSMVGAGIHSGDTLVVDRSIEPMSGHVVIAALEGEMTVKRVRLAGTNGRRRLFLVAENAAYPALEIGRERDLFIWGVVTHVLHAVR